MVRVRQKLGKYRLDRRIAEGGFADVFQAYDTVEGVAVALKVLPAEGDGSTWRDAFRREVRLMRRLDHPNVLRYRNADILQGHPVLAYELAEESLEDRMRRRLSTRTALALAEQMLDGLAHAHEHRVMHCDLKPENFLLFEDGQVRLGDFGIARISWSTRAASVDASGTLGYMAPEQAMGKPSFRSDVFSMGLVLYRLFSGELPEWPYAWPLPGLGRLRRRLPAPAVDVLRRALNVDERRRYKDAVRLRQAFRTAIREDRPRSRRPTDPAVGEERWRRQRERDFRRRFGNSLELRHRCGRCDGPLDESMRSCPWCGQERKVHRGPTRFTRRCRRCGRGMKADWRFCAWCHGPGYEPATNRRLGDKRYTARCGNPECERREQMPFMRYCPWCRRKVRRAWPLAGSREKCPRCHWGVADGFWSHCPWCGRGLGGSRSR